MPLEIEAKFRVSSHDAIRSRLRELGAVRSGAVLEINHIFDNADRSLLTADRGLRVRSSTVLDGVERPSTLTYKGRRVGGPFKRRAEIETVVGDPEAACRLLTALGFVEAVAFEKRRESWRLGDCRVELDELPHLGLYIEIEGPDEATVQRAREQLGLQRERSIQSSYIALLIDHCREHGLDTERIVFAEG